jgi:hypothetical protein
MTQEDKQLIADYMGLIFNPARMSSYEYENGREFHFDLNDAGLCVKKMEANSDADELEMFLVERQESGDCLECFLVWSYNADNFFSAMAAWLRERKEK